MLTPKLAFLHLRSPRAGLRQTAAPERTPSRGAAAAWSVLAVLAILAPGSRPAAAIEAAAAGAGAAPAESSSTHAFNAVDMQSMRRITEPQPSPRGDRVAFVVRSTDFEGNRGKTDLWLVGIDGSGARPLTADGAGYGNPRWSPDGATLYFLSSRSGSSQIWRLAPNAASPAGPSGQGAGVPPAGEPVQVTRLAVDITSFILSSDGALAAASADVFPDCPTLACTHDRLAARAKSKVKARLYADGTGFVRHWDVWENGTRSHLFVLPLTSVAGGAAGATGGGVGGGVGGAEGAAAGAGSEPVDVMRGMAADAPSKPFGGTEEYAFAPDGRSLVFAARDAGRQEPWSTNFDLYQAPLDGSRPPQDLTAANPAWDTYPAFSPDGKTLAYAAMTRPGFESDRYRIVLRDLASGRERRLAEEWDRSAGPLLFSADGRTLFTATEDLGQKPLFAIDVASGRVLRLTSAGHVESPELAAGDRLVFTLDSLRFPAEIYTVRRDGSGLAPITHLNQQLLAAARMGEVEQFHFAGAGGDTVYGWAVKPADFQPGRRYPIAFIIHGGPQVSEDNHFHYRWNPEVYAGAGYGVIAIDFHGSAGYGQAFTDSISQDWGGKPLQDLQLGLAAALARYPWLDGDRACALGASYGGFMTNWIAGNWPDRFRCLVTHDGVFDQRMMYYATEELWFPEWEMGGPYFQNPDLYEKFNPVRFVDRWQTPMLVIHGSLDYRIPVTQGLGAFTALQRRGIPSELLSFPEENHWVLKPADSLLWHQTVLAWLARWLAPAAGASR
ncbi:MAG TPA: S9 family peptidase [Thermoanaerobaculia bacterium]|nr:S9 family peptidase [Thermoanaerobaculia bacterium]